MKQENPPAFPTGDGHPGMTLRDYFAAKAMQGWLSNTSAWEPTQSDKTQNSFLKFVEASSFAAYAFADAMLEARGK